MLKLNHVFTISQEKWLSWEEPSLRWKMWFPTVLAAAFKTLILLTVSSWWPLASQRAATLIPVEMLSSDRWGKLWKWETHTVHPLENGMRVYSDAEVSDQNWRLTVFVKLPGKFLKNKLFKSTSSEMEQSVHLTFSVVSSILISVVFSEWHESMWDLILM